MAPPNDVAMEISTSLIYETYAISIRDWRWLFVILRTFWGVTAVYILITFADYTTIKFVIEFEDSTRWALLENY